MEESLLNSLLPSFFNFAADIFILFFSLPQLRDWVRSHFDQKIIEGSMTVLDFAYFQFFLHVSRFMEFVSFPYLTIVSMIVISPLLPELKIFSYWLLVLVTYELYLYICASIVDVIYKTSRQIISSIRS